MIKFTYLIFIDESLLRSRAIFSRFFVFILVLVFTSFHTLANEAETINYENLLSELNKQNKFIQDTISNLATTSERLRELETLAQENKRLEFELATARNKIEKNKQADTANNMQKEAYKSIIKALRKNLADAEKELTKQQDNSTKTDLLKAERQIALLSHKLSEVRKQLGKLEELLSLSEEREQEQKAQLKNVGSRLNQALASLAGEERKRRKLEESERKRLEEEIGKLTNQISNNSSEHFTGGIRIQSISSEPLTKFQEEFDFSYCYVGIEIYFENNEKKLFEIYLEQIDDQGILW